MTATEVNIAVDCEMTQSTFDLRKVLDETKWNVRSIRVDLVELETDSDTLTLYVKDRGEYFVLSRDLVEALRKVLR